MLFNDRRLMRVMGLDLGSKRIGVALSDESQTLATPFETVHRVSFGALLDRLAQIAGAQHVGAVVVGIPLSLDGSVGPQARHVAAEADRIRERLQLPLALWDERLTTVRAEQMLAEVGARQSARSTHAQRGAPRRALKTAHKRHSVDAVVAAMILQEYLDARPALGALPDLEGKA
jgi:putative Holliday junction resolvase